MGRRHIALLHFHFIKIERSAKHTGRGAGLEAAKGKAEAFKGGGKPLCPKQTGRAAFGDLIADEDAAFEVHAGCKDGASTGDHFPGGANAPRKAHACDTPVLHKDLRSFALQHVEVFLRLKGTLHALVVATLVHLRPKGMHGRPFAGVEHAHLDEFRIRRKAHFAAEGVHLPDKVTL